MEGWREKWMEGETEGGREGYNYNEGDEVKDAEEMSFPCHFSMPSRAFLPPCGMLSSPLLP